MNVRDVFVEINKKVNEKNLIDNFLVVVTLNLFKTLNNKGKEIILNFLGINFSSVQNEKMYKKNFF